jgi:hypothetical protein
VPPEDVPAEFASKLGAARQRFLSHVIEHGLSAGRRTPLDFLRHFPPVVLMDSLAKRADIRAEILAAATGIRPAIAERKSIDSAAEDLNIALEVGETDAETIVALLAPDDRVRYLDNRALWDYVAEGDFWRATDGIDFEIARAHVSYIIDLALHEKLLTAREIVDALTIERLAELLPREELAGLLAMALDRGREKKVFRDEDLLAAVPIAALAEHVPLSLLWQQVVLRRVAEVQGLTDILADAPQDTENRHTPESQRPPRNVPSDPPPSVEQAVRAFNGESTADVIGKSKPSSASVPAPAGDGE